MPRLHVMCRAVKMHGSDCSKLQYNAMFKVTVDNISLINPANLKCQRVMRCHMQSGSSEKRFQYTHLLTTLSLRYPTHTAKCCVSRGQFSCTRNLNRQHDQCNVLAACPRIVISLISYHSVCVWYISWQHAANHNCGHLLMNATT